MAGIPKTTSVKILTAVAAILVFLLVRQLYLRWLYESHDRVVEVCVELEQIKKICGKNNYPAASFLERAKTIGVNSLIIQEESFETLRKNARVAYFSNEDVVKNELLGAVGPSGALSADTLVVNGPKLAEYLKTVIKARTGSEPAQTKIGGYSLFRLNKYLADTGWGYLQENVETARNADMQVVYKPYKDFWLEENLPSNFSSLILSGIPDKQSAAELAVSNRKLAIIEFSGEEALYKKMFIRMPDRVYRMHRIEQEKLQRIVPSLSQEKLNRFIQRWIRAARERNCRMLYFDFCENLPLEDNFNYLRDTCNALKKAGFLLGTAQKGAPFGALPVKLSKILAFLTAVLTPVLSAFYISGKTQKENTFKEIIGIFCYGSAITVAGGLAVAALLSGSAFYVKLEEFGGIRPAMILSFVISAFIFFKYDEIKKFIESPISAGVFVLLAAAAAGAYTIMLRTGNAGEISGAESSARTALENFFLVRPRFKEFLAGHPLIVLGIGLNSAPLMLAGIIGQISIINTFMHSHTPLWVSLLRTVYGLIIGGLLGCLLLPAVKVVCRAGRIQVK